MGAETPADACRICGNAQGNRRHEAREMMFGTQERFPYIECAACGCLQIARIPEDMSAHYPAETYYSFADEPPASTGTGVMGGIRTARDRFAVTGKGFVGRIGLALKPADDLRALQPLPVTQASRILDVGCGAGTLLMRLFRIGYRNVTGIDPFLEADRASPDGPSLLRRTIHEVEREWDLIMFHHSFEHLPDPLATLRSVARHLAPDGVCLIRMPTTSSDAWREYGTDWVQLDAPRHLHIHSVESIGRLAERAGMVVDSVEYDSTAFQFWGSEQYRRGIPLMAPNSYAVAPDESIFSAGEIRRFARRARRLNGERRGDAAAFYLRRAGP